MKESEYLNRTCDKKNRDRSAGVAYSNKQALMAITAVIVMAISVAFAGCSAQEDEYDGADITRIKNGYGTIFVSGRTIEHVADTSTSTVVKWSNEPVARASKGFKMDETDGIVYKTADMTDGRDKGKPLQLKMNIKKDAKAMSPQPVILFVPGGGFITCEIDRKYKNVHRYLVENGYAVAVMKYRVIGQGTYVDAIQDVRDAIDWLGEHGDKYGLSTVGGVYLVGNSGGGYLASMAACQDPSDIRCVVNFYGLSALADNKSDYEEAAIKAHHTPQSSDSQFTYGVYSDKALGEDPETDKLADPVTYVDGDEPPFIHFHGDADLWVSPSQSLHLHEALLARNEVSKRYVAKGEGHGGKGFRTKRALDAALSFMKQY